MLVPCNCIHVCLSLKQTFLYLFCNCSLLLCASALFTVNLSLILHASALITVNINSVFLQRETETKHAKTYVEFSISYKIGAHLYGVPMWISLSMEVFLIELAKYLFYLSFEFSHLKYGWKIHIDVNSFEVTLIHAWAIQRSSKELQTCEEGQYLFCAVQEKYRCILPWHPCLACGDYGWLYPSWIVYGVGQEAEIKKRFWAWLSMTWNSLPPCRYDLQHWVFLSQWWCSQSVHLNCCYRCLESLIITPYSL